jgi:hypothetical protein
MHRWAGSGVITDNLTNIATFTKARVTGYKSAGHWLQKRGPLGRETRAMTRLIGKPATQRRTELSASGHFFTAKQLAAKPPPGPRRCAANVDVAWGLAQVRRILGTIGVVRPGKPDTEDRYEVRDRIR